jgi:hypothetical protein
LIGFEIFLKTPMPNQKVKITAAVTARLRNTISIFFMNSTSEKSKIIKTLKVKRALLPLKSMPVEVVGIQFL